MVVRKFVIFLAITADKIVIQCARKLQSRFLLEDLFLTKESAALLPEFVDRVLQFYRQFTGFITATDGGYAAALTFKKTGIPFSFTGHSLGAQKLDKLGTTTDNWHSMKMFKFQSE